MVYTMRKLGMIVAALAALTLAACGGGSSTSAFGGASSSGGSTATAVAAVAVITSTPQIPSDNSKSATITAIVRDSNNNAVSGASVLFSSTSGLLAGSPAVTDDSGTATATLSTPGAWANRTITVTASVGSISSTVQVAVAGTSVSVSGPASLVKGSQGTYTVNLTDFAGNPIANQTVAVTSSAGNTLSAASLTTDANGHATFQVTAVNAGNDTLTATVLGQSATETVAVSAQNFAFSAPLPVSPATSVLVPLGTSQAVTVVWTTNGTAQAGQVITFSTTRGAFAGGAVSTTATTDSSGTATVDISASSAGPAVVTASATGVTAQLALTFIATTPAAIDLQASPSTIATLGQSTITAIVRDANDNLVEGQTVTFQLTDVTGGAISVGSATTDVQGRAQTVYTASSTASATNGVMITATVQSTVTSSVTLTVGGQAVFLSLGTGSQIYENPDKTQFSVPFIVQAQDSAGNAVNGVAITLKVHSLDYAKGVWVSGTPWTWQPSIECANEDVYGTGIFQSAEDVNSNGKLDPGDIASVSPGSVTTAASTYTSGDTTFTTNGSASLTVSYPEDHASWVEVVLTATATVQGTEASTTSTFWLPVAATYVASPTVHPPGVSSPYGIDSTCADTD